MPIYEYRCGSCGQRSNLFFRSFATVGDAACAKCASTDMQRLVSKVAVLRNSDQQVDRLADLERSGLGQLNDQYDPQQVERWARDMGQRYDSELGANFREMADQMASGERPYDLYDPRGAFQSALEGKYRELTGFNPYDGLPPDHPARIQEDLYNSIPPSSGDAAPLAE